MQIYLSLQRSPVVATGTYVEVLVVARAQDARGANADQMSRVW